MPIFLQPTGRWSVTGFFTNRNKELTEMTCLSSYSRLVGGLLLGSLLPRIRS